MSRTRTLMKIGVGIAVTGATLLSPGIALAQGASTANPMISGAVNLVLIIVTVLNFLAWFFLSILDHIMDPTYIFSLDPSTGEDTALLNMLREIWQFTRDMVNLGFAISLIVGAIIMIVTADGTKLKEYMPKFVLALVLVNFSWFIPRVIFDVSQIMTYTVYQIPSLLGAEGCTLPPATDDAEPRPCEVVLNYKFFESNTINIGSDGRDRSDGSTGWTCPLGRLVCIQTVPITDAGAQVRTATKVLNGLVVNHARLQTLGQFRITETEARLAASRGLGESAQIVMGLVIKLVIFLVLHIALLFPLIAMAAAFFIRIPVLWVTMAFMPLVALGFVFAFIKEFTQPILDNFLKAVFLPVKVAIPFAIGFIMLNAGSGIPAPAGFGVIPNLPILAGVRDLWQFLWMGIALFIIWKFGFEQLIGEKAGFAGMFTEKIKSLGSSLGSLATQLPLSVPFIPLPGRRVLNEETGKMETQRISLGQGLRVLDPRNLNEQLRSIGRLEPGGVSRRAGIAPPTAVDLNRIFTIRADIRSETVLRDIRTAGGAGSAEERTAALNRALEEVRRTAGADIVGGRRIQDVIEALIRSDDGLRADTGLPDRIRALLGPRRDEIIR